MNNSGRHLWALRLVKLVTLLFTHLIQEWMKWDQSKFGAPIVASYESVSIH